MAIRLVYNTKRFRANVKEAFDKAYNGHDVIITNRQRAFRIQVMRRDIEDEQESNK
jgi:hypothetical protein